MSDITENTKELKKVEIELRKQNALVQAFLRGLMAALGATVGLSIFLGISALILNFLATSFGLQTVIQPFLDSVKK